MGVRLWILPFGSAAAMLLSAGVAGAQVDTDAIREWYDADAFDGALQGTMSGRAGNVDQMTAGGTFHAQGALGSNWALGVLAGNYSRTNEKITRSRTFAYAAYAYRIRPWLQGEAFVQDQSDKFRLLRFRNILGIGPRFRVIAVPWAQVFTATSYMYEYELLNVESIPQEDATSFAHRWHNSLTFRFLVDDRVKLHLTSYIQPRFDDVSDYRWLEHGLLTFSITSILDAKISVEFRYDSDPPRTVESIDVEVNNGLSLNF